MLKIKHDINQIITILNQGGIIIFPTDTAFGIGCRMDDEKAVKKLFKLRKRPESQATPVLINGIEMAQKYLHPIPKAVTDQLIAKYWPGALTIVLPCKSGLVPELVRGGSGTLGVRMPNNRVVLQLIKEIGVPLLGPSANFHGDKTPYRFEDLDPELIKLVDFVIKGDIVTKDNSTLIDCSSHPWKILRSGAVRLDLNH